MNGRRLARWAMRATLLGALAAGIVYSATAASAGAIWGVKDGTTVGIPVNPAPAEGPGSAQGTAGSATQPR